LKYIVM